ncbi:hypothetical protein O181_015835 [Austropuccinia psidii MF-1]|uniref:Uncharacterized protein n=1 Tax=Austropuccinia psidii MF-1 TaxID=1389203 RepID=A0A9Q3C3P9_9BASI|nr:hypothetical protein [Austropuccinia psidii MF-1]
MVEDLSQQSDSKTQRKNMREKPVQVEKTLSIEKNKVKLSSSSPLISLEPLSPLDKVSQWQIQQNIQVKDPKGKGKAKVTEYEASRFEEAEKSRLFESSKERIKQKSYVTLCHSERLYSQRSMPSTCQSLQPKKIKGKGKVLSVLIPEREIKSISQNTNIISSSGKPLTSHQEQGDLESEESSRAIFYTSGSSEKHSYFNQGEFSILPKEIQLLQLPSPKIIAPSSLSRLQKSFGMASEGTPKVAEWLVLFTINLPLILLPHWEWVETKTPCIAKLISAISKLKGVINTVISHTLDSSQIERLDKDL